jgi:hypothetical protein
LDDAMLMNQPWFESAFVFLWSCPSALLMNNNPNRPQRPADRQEPAPMAGIAPTMDAHHRTRDAEDDPSAPHADKFERRR